MEELKKIFNKVFNFNHKSYVAWFTLAGALIACAVPVLKLFGITVTADQTKDITMAITAVLNVFVALGILTGKMDDPDK